MRAPLVSVIMPVYNAASYLEESIRSILNQTFADFEFLIFEDGSTDRSLSIIQAFQDERIKVIVSPQNRGYVHHLNEGIALARGKYIARMDADDISDPQRLEKQVAFMEENSRTVLCGTRYRTIGSSESYGDLPCSDEQIRLSLLYNNVFCHPSVLIRKSTLHENGLRYPLVHVIEDYGLWSQLAFYGNLANLPAYLLHYRDGVGVSSKPLPQELRDENGRMFREYACRFFQGTLLTRPEIEELSRLLNLKVVQRTGELYKFASLMKKVLSRFSNEQVSREALETFLKHHFFYLCTTSTVLGPKVLWCYCKNGLGSASSILTIKLAIKSLLYYKAR